MEQAIAVIGAQFGDEGKGLCTDFFSAPYGSKATVIRYCGGGQAGHTVVTPEGKRHVFHHFGSGSFTGAHTFLSRFFITNPYIWQEEIALLPFKPVVFIDPEAFVTTPYDMLLNQEVERLRGNGRHGSCGKGINETVQRNKESAYTTFVKDISHRSKFKARLRSIREEYVPYRMKELNLDLNPFLENMFASENLIENFINSAENMRHSSVVCPIDFIDSRQKIIFEGAQGLLLDEDHYFFPHVTRAKTGLHNIAILCQEMGIKDVEAVYVSRAYMTRHGAGPFPTEDKSLAYEDKTNVLNDFQGNLRFGYLDVDLLSESINKDTTRISNLNIKKSIALTCLDQVKPIFKIRKTNKYIEESTLSVIEIIKDIVKSENFFTSNGPTRETFYKN